MPFLPEAVHGQMVIGLLGVYAGPVEHVKIWCVNGHGFTPPLDTLAIQPALPEPVAATTVG